MELQELIMETTIYEFNDKSAKFTMDDIAKKLHISKKTIYSLFQTKEELLMCTVNYVFDQIKVSEQRILEDDSLATLDKLKRILTVLPEPYENIDWRKIYLCKDKYPNIYKQIERRLETQWDGTFKLLNQAIDEKLIKPISLPIFKAIVQSSIENFISSATLLADDIPYTVALNEFISIILYGITTE